MADLAPTPHKWSEYYQAVTGQPFRQLLLSALAKFEEEFSSPSSRPVGFAVDLACGTARDTVELLQRNWRVLAIDGEPETVMRLRRYQDINRAYLETRIQQLADLSLPPDIDLINAGFCLNFYTSNCFPQIWEVIKTALKPGGRFCGQLLGDRDSWAVYSDLKHHSRKQVNELFSAFNVELFNEEERSSTTALGVEKHWHFYEIVARKH
jgi:tellurite methyltransferase